jgi:hypothetical protein
LADVFRAASACTASATAPRKAGRYALVLTARVGAETVTDRARLTVM